MEKLEVTTTFNEGRKKSKIGEQIDTLWIQYCWLYVWVHTRYVFSYIRSIISLILPTEINVSSTNLTKFDQNNMYQFMEIENSIKCLTVSFTRKIMCFNYNFLGMWKKTIKWHAISFKSYIIS